MCQRIILAVNKAMFGRRFRSKMHMHPPHDAEIDSSSSSSSSGGGSTDSSSFLSPRSPYRAMGATRGRFR